MRKPLRSVVVITTLLLAANACGSSDKASTGGSTSTSPGSASTSAAPGTTVAGGLDVTDFEAVKAAAKGQTVNWWMYGGDDTINAFVSGFVADKLKSEFGVTLNQVKITDTKDAVQKVLDETQAGKKTGGSVDAIWINGENFATGVQADLWTCGYPEKMPSAEFVDFSVPTIANDFGVPVKGCESPWQQANSALVYNSDVLKSSDVETLSTVETWAKANPGKFTYTAPPDFTGSMVVRTFFYDTNGGPGSFGGKFDQAKYAPAADKTWKRLNDLKPALWMKGATYPQTESDLEKLYADGTLGAYLTYAPGGVTADVKKGTLPKSTRTAVFKDGNIGNYSFISVPKNAAHQAAGIVLADVLLDLATQVAFFKASGAFPAISLSKIPGDEAATFSAPASESVLGLDKLQAKALPELEPAYVTQIEKDWKTNVLQK